MSSVHGLFGRAYTLTLKGDGGQSVVYGNMHTGQSPLRMSFQLDKNAVGSSNKCSFALFNISPQLRNTLKTQTLMTLEAGYQGLTQTLFVGYVRTATSERQGPDIVTSLSGGDGEYAIQYSVINQTWGPGTAIAQVLHDIAAAMAVPDPLLPAQLSAGQAIGIPKDRYPNGFTFFGLCRDALNTVLGPLGLVWFVDNANLIIVPKDRALGQDAVVVSAATGMINIPSVTGPYTTFQSLLNPALTPKRLVHLVSPLTATDGYFQVVTSKFEGDTHDAAWNVTCQCSPVTSAVIDLSATGSFDYVGASS